MIIKSYEIKKNKSNLAKSNFFLLYGENLGLKKDSLPRGGGGLSGLAIFPRTLQMINLFSDMNLIIMATGGISTIHHLNAAKDAGATLFGMATSLIMDPYCIPKINHNLSKGY